MNFSDIINTAPDNLTILDSLGKAYQHINNHDKIVVAISGGADSDIMLDMIIRCGGKNKTRFVFFNTGLEYEATKRQLKSLEEKYGIEIEVLPPIKPIPLCVKEYGIPFWSKQISDYISRLQQHNFQWEDEPLEVLLEKYPRCKAALKWWCNAWPAAGTRSNSRFNISYTPYLKEFIIANPPTFKISANCCVYAKKNPVKKFMKASGSDLNCVGIRRAEGGVRATGHNSCYKAALTGPNQYYPLFWFTDSDKTDYEVHYGITHSDCYTVWGMKRTGCAGCPFARNYEEELKIAQQHEPKFHKAMLKIFGPSYEYRRQFEAFRKRVKEAESCL